MSVCVTVATPVHQGNGEQPSRSVDISGIHHGYIVSHSRFGDAVRPNYSPKTNSTLTLGSLCTQTVQVNIEYLDMEGYETGECYADDQLKITGLSDAICGVTPNTFTVNLDTDEISFQFTTNDFDEGKGFWLQYRGKQE